MKILWLTWKDRSHPQAGGAELVNEELAKRLVKEGHEVTFLVGGFTGGTVTEKRDGFSIVRRGNRFTVYWHAYRYYKKHIQNWPDIVIDEVNTIPFFAKLYVRQKNILFVHQLCREIWFYQMLFPFSLVGYLLEPLYLWFLRDREVITVSESTKRDLLRFGFERDNIHIISEGLELIPLESEHFDHREKYTTPTILALGSVRPMKRTDHVVKAFELLKRKIPQARLIIAGDTSGVYGANVLAHIQASSYRNDIDVLGRVSQVEKVELLQKSHVLAVTSVKEGWGLVVTEANSQGTPAVVYDIDGLRDAVKDGTTGLVTEKNTPVDLAKTIAMLLRDQEKYATLRRAAWQWSKTITFEKSYDDLTRVLAKF